MELDNVEDDLNVLETTDADIEKFIVAGKEEIVTHCTKSPRRAMSARQRSGLINERVNQSVCGCQKMDSSTVNKCF